MKPPKILPPVILLFCFLTSLGLHFLLEGKIPWRFQSPIAGAVLFVGGFLFMARARCLFQECKTPIKPTETPTAMVRHGPYRLTRNPMYLGFVVMLSGAALLIGTLPMFLAPLAFFLILRSVYVPREEERMEKIFGQEYLDYKKRVRRWI